MYNNNTHYLTSLTIYIKYKVPQNPPTQKQIDT